MNTGKPKTVYRVGVKSFLMAVKFVDLADTYKPKTSTKDIIVDVTIGDGQVGSYSIFLDREFINSDAPGNIGKKKDVSGKNTIVVVPIVDVLEETNWTSMTVTVTEGEHTTVYGPYKALAENHLDTVIYSLKIVNQ